MPTHGIGSINSPIIISDDEDEISIVELLRAESPSNTNDGDRVFATVETRDGDVWNGVNDRGVPNMDHQQRARELSDRVEPVPAMLKRKRDEGCVGSNFSGPGIISSIGDVYSRPESKKARKRRRRLERMEAQLAMEREQMKNAEYMLRQRQQQRQQRTPHLLAQMPPLQPWGAWSPFNSNPSGQSLVQRSMNHLNIMTQGIPVHESVGKGNMTSSTPHSQSSSSLPPKPVSIDTLPVKPHNSMYPVAPMGQSRFPQQTASPVQVQLPVPKTQPNPTRKTTLIGVSHDTNPNSPHGFFTSSKNQPNGEPYAPNPSRTLVMEQLPKNYRKRDVVRSWCKSVCGIFPVHAEVNAKGKALIEFPSAEMARRAFMSPQDVFGKSPVRVWWYRGIPGSKKGEIEDGEIDESENQGSEKPVLASNAKKKKVQQSLKKWELKQKNLNWEADLATRPAAGSSSGGGTTQLNVQSLSSLPLTHNMIHLTSVPNSTLRPPLAGQRPLDDCREPDKGLGFDDSGYAAEQDYSDDASIASSRAGSAVVELVTPNTRGDNEYFSEDMDVESPVANRRPSDVLNAHSGLANRRQRMSPRQDAGIYAQHGVSNSPIPRMSRESQPTPSTSDSTPQESSNDSSNPAVSSARPLKVPSEVRAVKSTPTGPSYAKRKDLEERIRIERTKAADRDHARATSSELATIPTPASSGTVTPIVPVPADVVDKVAIEDNLRRLVLESKRNKGHGSAGPSVPPSSDSVSCPSSNPINYFSTTSNGSSIVRGPSTPASSVSSTTSVTENLTTSNSVEVTAPSQNALDDLAVSFITEAIQTIKSPSPVQLKPSQVTMLELAAKQQKLEKQIAESKILMAQLHSARTKQEKDRILTVMREQSRAMEAEARPTSVAVAGSKSLDCQTTKDCVHRWPETREDAGVLMISDDEDDM